MRLMVIGGGGREHAIIKKLKVNKKISALYALPGNGGIAEDAECIPIKATDIEGVKKFALENKIDYAVVAPDDPLVLGMVDELNSIGIRCFGPSKAAAEIEGSKVFSKNLMKKYSIPTAEYEVFNDSETAINYLKGCGKYPVVIKADGLALGKGVLICNDFNEAIDAVKLIMKDKAFGISGNSIVIEEFLEGPEVSVLCFTDGMTVIPMVSSMDHKRAHDNDEGLNTGGMGCIAPNPYYTEKIASASMETIIDKTIDAMNKEGRKFKGCLYFGLMITKNGPKVIEYNCRFGDPETQVILPLLKTDLLTIFEAITDEKLNEINIEFENKASCCVMAVSNGYPEKYDKGFRIKFGNIHNRSDVEVFHSGTVLKNGEILSNGGRVIGVTAIADDLQSAVDKAYDSIKEINFENRYFRLDIGKRALQCK